jgi:uncharacterized protein (TIGR02246 family)
MKFFFIFLTVFSSMLGASGQNQSSQDSIHLLSIINDWNTAWQTKNYRLAAKGYSQDARFTNAFGDKRNGQAEVEALLKEVFSLPFVMAGHSETSEHRYQVLNGTTVIVHTAVTRKGQKMPDDSVLSDRQTTHMRVFQKTAGKWEIEAHLISDARDKQVPKH